MKNPDERRESAFNSPAEAGTRVAYLGCLAGMTCGLSVSLVGIFTGRGMLLAGGTGLLIGAWAVRVWLKQRGKLANLDRSLENVTSGEPARAEAEPQVEHLVSLLKQWDNLEHKRGSPEFDPWAVQAVRHDIHVAIEQNPALERLFHT